MFSQDNSGGYVELLDGVKIKTLAHGEKTLTAKFQLQKGAEIPIHKHPHEQAGYLVSGKIEFTLEEKKVIALPGDSWCIEGNVVHGAKAIDDSVVIEVFSPVRADYLPQNLERKMNT